MGPQSILGISASSRVWGNCEASVKLALLSAMDEGARTDFIRLTDLKIDACRGCFTCLSDARACAIEDDLGGLLERIGEARALVLAAPVYFGLPPAVLVSVLDRLLVVTAARELPRDPRPAVTITLMGNEKWRGVAQPVVNTAVSLLGFEIAESVSIVAEGPGEVLSQPGVVEKLKRAGKSLVAAVPSAAGRPSAPAPPSTTVSLPRTGQTSATAPQSQISPQYEAGAPSAASRSRPNQCPICRSDFFRIEEGFIVCPVCGEKGELVAYTEDGRFLSVGGERRWGTPWLRSHVASWIKPSVMRYKARRREALKNLAELKRLYSLKEGDKEKDRDRAKESEKAENREIDGEREG
jgi:multimeric flavodoxin WrbA/uncharacterized Zn finger protein (UPF0148 family)